MRIIIVLLLTVALSQIATEVKNCMENPKVIFTAATLSVVPAKGVNETMTLYGTAQEHAELDNVLIKAKWNGIDSYEQDYPEEDAYDKGDPVTYSQSQLFPTYTPSGKITVQFHFQNARRVDFACAEVGFVV